MDVPIDATTLLDGCDDGGEVVVHENHIRDSDGHACATVERVCVCVCVCVSWSEHLRYV